MSSAPLPAIEALTAAAAVRAALETGLLRTIERLEPISVAELASRTHLQEQGVQAVVDALDQLGVVTVDVNDVRLVGSADAWNAFVDIAPQVLGLLEGRPACGSMTSPHAYRSVAEVVGRLTSSVITPWVEGRARPGLRVLEVGCGDAPWTRALAACEAAVRPTLLDHAEVLDATMARLGDVLASTHVETVAGDAFRVDLGGPHDLIIVSGFCRLFDARANARLFARLREVIARDGELLVLDAVEFDDPAELALYRLSLASRRRHARTHAIGDYRAWLTAAGFEDPHVTRTGQPHFTLLATRSTTDGAARQD